MTPAAFAFLPMLVGAGPWDAPWIPPPPPPPRADSVTFRPGRIPIPGLPLEVRRFHPADLDTAVPSGASRAGIAAPGSRSVDTGSGLRFSGEKTLRVGVGGEGGVAVDQTLRLDAEGEVSPGVQVRAHLSDQQVPLGAEGSTEALRELDEVSLEVRTRRWDLVAGDQDWALPQGASPGAARRLRGLSVGWHDGWTLRGTLGSPRARWMRTVFAGIEGRQEGWTLPGPEGRAHAPVVPGSERVAINGVRLEPGTDYLLRPAEGAIDFLPRRRIAASDRIEVEWQAATLDYRRSLQAAQGAAGTPDQEGLRWQAWAAREADDPTSPLSYAPTPEADSLLREAGSDAWRARRPDSSAIPLPAARDDAGVRLGWTRGHLLRLDAEARGTRVNRNLASERDRVVPGAFLAASASSRLGASLDDGGTGLVGLSLSARGNDDGFRPLSGRAVEGSAGVNTWNDDGTSAEGRLREGVGAVSWEATPGLGAWTEAGLREDSAAFARRAAAKVGLDRRERRLFAEGSAVRREEGARTFDRWWAHQAASWPTGPFVPRLETRGEDRQVPAGAWRTARTRWGEAIVGSTVEGFDGRLEGDLQAQARLDQTDRAGEAAQPRDSARSRGLRLESRWTDAILTADGLVDAKLVERRTADGAWNPDQTWLGESRLAAHPLPGLEGEVRWRLTLSDFLPEIQAWDSVPPGTGTHRWDPVTRQVVAADDGDLVSAGLRLDTTRAPVRSSRRLLALEGTIEPGRIREDLEGILADVGLHGRAEWEQADSSGRTRLLPDFGDDALASSVEGRSSLEADLWWARAGHRLDLGASRDRIVAGASAWSAATGTRELQWRAAWGFEHARGHRAELPWRRRDRLLSGQDLSRRETVDVLEPLVSARLVRILDLSPSVLLGSGSGRDGSQEMRGSLASPALGASLRLGRDGRLRSEVRWARASTEGPAGGNLTEGFLDGRTWRASAGLDWKTGRHVSASADWTWRADPGREPFQKASAEARAVF